MRCLSNGQIQLYARVDGRTSRSHTQGFAYRIKKMRENYPELLTLAEREAANAVKREQAIKDFEKWQSSHKKTDVDASQHINYNE